MKSFIVFGWMFAAVCAGAAPFRNLGFDDGTTNTAQIIGLDPIFKSALQGVGPTEDLLPGWKVFSDLDELATIGLNLRPEGDESSFVTLFDALYGAAQFPADRFALLLQGISLQQTGEIPVDARAITYTSSGLLIPSINGEPLPQIDLFGPEILFDVSRFAGQTVDLTFQPSPSGFPPGGTAEFLDTIRFVPVPEPSTWVLLAGGIVVWLAMGSKRRQTARLSKEP